MLVFSISGFNPTAAGATSTADTDGFVNSSQLSMVVNQTKGTAGPCTNNHDVTVVIDFHELKDGLIVRCAQGPQPNQPYTGFDALSEAGIVFRTTVRFPGFVCRIQDLPSNDPCIDASPAHAYWSYWLAPRGGQWCYSNWGAGNRAVPPGSVEGWSFSLSKTASTSPPPRYSVPQPLPGTSATRLKGDDCDASATAPASPPTASLPTTSPQPRTSTTSPPAAQAPVRPTTPTSPAPTWPADDVEPSEGVDVGGVSAEESSPGELVNGKAEASTLVEDSSEVGEVAHLPLSKSHLDDEDHESGISTSDHNELAFFDPDDFDLQESASPIGAVMAVIVLALLTVCGVFVAKRRRHRDAELFATHSDRP